jgi:hypothetical protein
LLVFLIFGTVFGFALCWCWQCLLTVGGNLLPHVVTPLDVTTVAWCCRQTQDILHPAEWQPGTLQISESRWTESVITTWHCTGRSCSLFGEVWCSQQTMTLWFVSWTDYKWQVSYILHPIR